MQQQLATNIENMEHKLDLWNTKGEDGDAAEIILADYQVNADK